MSFKWLDIAKEIQSLPQAGLEYSQNQYDIERYHQLRELSIKIMHEYTGTPIQQIRDLFATEKGYQTPKVDVRGVVFRAGKILMVRENLDGKWTLPGGWADVGYSPFEIAAKETEEEAGIKVVPERLLAVFNKKKHTHPPNAYHVYKFFILCKDPGGQPKPGTETSDTDWVDRNDIPSLSTPRITAEQIQTMFEYLDNPDMDTVCD